MFNLMLDYALEYELVDKNYARTFDLSNDIIKEKEAATRGHIIFTDKEMHTLWDHVDSSVLWTGFSFSAIWDGVHKNWHN